MIVIHCCYLITKKIAKRSLFFSLFLVFFWRNQFLERFFVIGNKIFVGMSRGGLREEFSIFFFVFFSQNRLRDTNIYQMHQIKTIKLNFDCSSKNSIYTRLCTKIFKMFEKREVQFSISIFNHYYFSINHDCALNWKFRINSSKKVPCKNKFLLNIGDVI